MYRSEIVAQKFWKQKSNYLINRIVSKIQSMNFDSVCKNVVYQKYNGK